MISVHEGTAPMLLLRRISVLGLSVKIRTNIRDEFEAAREITFVLCIA